MSSKNFSEGRILMKTYQDLTYEFLYDQYIIQQKTIREIAKETGFTKKQIQRLIHKFKIKTRIGKPNNKFKYKNKLTKTFLNQKYVKEGQSIKEISTETGIPSRTISKYIDWHKITRRTCGTRKGKKNKHKFPYKTDIKIGDSYAYLTVVEIKDNELTCQCKCGNIKKLHTSRIRNKQVKSCGCLMHRTGINHPICKGYGSIPNSVYTKCKVNGLDRNIIFNLTIEDLDSQYQNQKGKCAISGIDIGFNNHKKKSKMLSTASLDRIDSDRPYEIGNIQWVHKQVQQMKWTTKQDEFIEWCKIIANNN